VVYSEGPLSSILFAVHGALVATGAKIYPCISYIKSTNPKLSCRRVKTC